MALVAYEDSDIEDDECQDESDTEKSSFSLTIQKDSTQRLLHMLPKPTTKKIAIDEEDDEFLHKKETPSTEKPKVKIIVPSLSDFDDVKQKPSKSKVFNNQKSGLLSILPQPKNAVTATTKTLIPHSVNQKQINTVKKKDSVQVKNNKSHTEKPLQIDFVDDSDDDEDIQNDFFAINKAVTNVEPNKSDVIDRLNDVIVNNITDDVTHDVMVDNIINDVNSPSDQTARPSIESYLKKDIVQDLEEQIPTHIDPVSENCNEKLVLDEEAIVKLCGARGKRKREEIQIVEVNQKEVLADARELLLKGLMDDTSKRASSSKRRGHEPTSQQKRKHQITYLAHQAKANEADLQNQWANSRMSRRQTQSKYGF